MTATEQMIDLGPAAREVAALAARVHDDQLADPTPCADTTVGELLAHLLGLAGAFRRAAEKAADEGPPGPWPQPPPDWRSRLPAQLDALVAAWRDPAAWRGEAAAGGVTMPAADLGVVALDELVLHGWDLARATGQEFRCDPAHVDAVLDFTDAVARAGPQARAGLFGPPVAVAAGASPFERALSLSGRDPDWTP